jgi:hypothetical protein
LKLPAVVWSQLGEIPVKHESGMIESKDEPAFGRWSSVRRDITIDPSPCAATQLATLCHEVTHVALWDAGGENVLTEAQTEFVCDALGVYLAGAIQNGYIKLCVPKG